MNSKKEHKRLSALLLDREALHCLIMGILCQFDDLVAMLREKPDHDKNLPRT